MSCVLPVLGPLLLLNPFSNFWPKINASFFKISSDLLQAFTNWTIHELLLTLRLSKTSTPHKSSWPAFQPFLTLSPGSPCPAGSSYRRLTFGPYPKSKRLQWQGSHGVSLLTQLILLTLQTKNKITVIFETDQIDILFSHWHLPSQSYKTTRFQTSVYVTTGLNYRLKINHPFREFFIGGVKEGLCQKRRMLVLLKSQSLSLFLLINFPFLAWLPSSLSFALHSPYTSLCLI